MRRVPAFCLQRLFDILCFPYTIQDTRYLSYKFDASGLDNALADSAEQSNAGVPACALGVSRRVDIVQLLHHFTGASHARINSAAGCERIFLGGGDHALYERPELFGAGDGRGNGLIEDERTRKAAQKRHTLALLAS